jgi:Uma2 family endonuclease
MRVVMLEAPEELLAERRRKGLDRWDEVWEGVLHVVPAPSPSHQRVEGRLYRILAPIAESKGLEALTNTEVHKPGATKKTYWVPDISITSPSRVDDRGIQGGCEFLVEVLSPDDETHEKIPFYGEIGVQELLVVNPDTREHQLYVLSGKKLLPLSTDPSGSVRSSVLGVSFAVVPGPKLRVSWSGGEALV